MLRNGLFSKAFKPCINQKRGILKSVSSPYLWRNEPRFLKKYRNNSYEKQNVANCLIRHYGSEKKKTKLMDFEVVFSTNFFRTLKVEFMTFFIVRQIDPDFNMNEFLDNTKVALEVVSKLLSDSRFSHLDGLLTSECKGEVEENVKSLSPSQRQELAVFNKDIVCSFPSDLNIIKDNQTEKIFLQITVVYHIMKNFTEHKNASFYTLMEYLAKSTIYNCRFIKECTKGVNDCWIINAINLHKQSEGLLEKNQQ